jgi:fatty-acyl-CoA synthase
MPPVAPSQHAAGTLSALVEKSLVENAVRPALTCDGQQLSYDALDRASHAALRDLQQAGVTRGDRVALLLANGLEFPIYDVALLRLGAVKVPLNDMLSAGDVAYCLEHSGARVVVVSATLTALAEAAAAELDPPPARLAARAAQELVEAMAVGAGPPSVAAVGLDDVAAVFYTGGTTGQPKGVVHSQRTLALNQLSTVIEAEIGRDERLLVTTPLPHAAGLFTMAGLVRGALVVIMRRFDAAGTLAAIEEHAITWTFMVPTMIYRVLDAVGASSHDHRTLRTVVYGAAPINPDRLAEALDVFGPAFIQLYGQTEVPNFATTLSKGDHVLARERPELLLSCGRPVLMAEVSVRDDDGRTVASGEVGEVCVRSPYTMVGYFGDPAASRDRFFGAWLRTGDIAALDAEGYLFLKDRRSDMVISGGMNVYTAVVERVIAEAPGVAQVAVVGIPDPDWGEAVHAVVTASEPGVTEDDVIAYCRDRLARYMQPKSVEVIDALPLTPYGKMDKKALRARHWSGQVRQIG